MEFGAQSVEGLPNAVALGNYEMASRISYFLTGSMPDDELFAAAAAGELQTPEQVEAHARRLVEQDSTVAMLGRFHEEWLGVYEFVSLARDPGHFPLYNDAMPVAMEDEIDLITRFVMDELDGSVSSLLSTPTYPVTDALAPVYGVPAGQTPDFQGRRRGILTSATFMASINEGHHPNPVGRGARIRRQILCGSTGTLPPDLDATPTLSGTAGLPTAKERLAPMLENADCASCHRTMNPIGLAFENYDALGQWRDTENGATIDPSGTLEYAGEIDGDFADAMELVDRLAESEDVTACYAKHLYQFAIGRLNLAVDRCDVYRAEEAAKASGGDIREMLVQMTQLDHFMYRRVSGEGTL